MRAFDLEIDDIITKTERLDDLSVPGIFDLSLVLNLRCLGSWRWLQAKQKVSIGRHPEGAAKRAKTLCTTMRLPVRQDERIPSLGDRQKLRQTTANLPSKSRSPESQPAGVTWGRDLETRPCAHRCNRLYR